VESFIEGIEKSSLPFGKGRPGGISGHHGVLEEGVKFIQKPFAVEELARKIREVLDK